MRVRGLCMCMYVCVHVFYWSQGAVAFIQRQMRVSGPCMFMYVCVCTCVLLVKVEASIKQPKWTNPTGTCSSTYIHTHTHTHAHTGLAGPVTAPWPSLFAAAAVSHVHHHRTLKHTQVSMLLFRVGQNRVCTPHMTVYLIKSLQEIPYIYILYIYMYFSRFGQPYSSHPLC